MMRFVDIKNDVAFRKIFGNQKKSICLISFLNAVLNLEGNNRIVKVTIINPYILPNSHDGKSSIIDVRATDQKNRRFVVEMQVGNKKGFEKRVQFYTARDYSAQIEKGEDYLKLKPTYFIGILDFNIGKGKNYVAKHFFVEEETGENVLDDIQFRFIQLSKFKKKIHELVTMIDKWTYFIKHAEKLQMIPNDIEDEGLITAYTEADKFTWKKNDLIAYDNASMRIQDERGAKEFARDEGKAEGIELGIELGEERKEKDAIIGLYENGVPVSIIALSLKIHEDKVSQIINEYLKSRNSK